MKKFLRLLLIVALVVVALGVLISLLAPPIIKSRIEKKLTHLPGDSLSIATLRVQFFPLGLKASDAHFSFHQPGDSLLVQWRGHLSEIEVKGIDWWNAWRHDTWEVGFTEIAEGELSWEVTEIELDSSTRAKKDTATKANFLLESLDIDQLKLHLLRDSSSIHLEVSAAVDSFGFDPRDSVRWRYSQISLHSDSAHFDNHGSDYDLYYLSLDYESKREELKIKGFRMEPRLSQEEWDRQYPYRKSRIIILDVPTITVEQLELDRLHQGVFAHKLRADSTRVEIFSDQRRQRQHSYKALPSELITKIPFPVEFDSISVNHGSLLYQFYGQTGLSQMARLEGDQVQLHVYPFSNLGHKSCADVNIDMDMRLMNHPVMTLRAHCFADRPNHDFEFDASLSSTSFAAFNPVILPGVGVEFKEGFCEQLRVHVEGNDHGCHGDLDIAYDNLEVSFADIGNTRENIVSELKEKAANWIIINDDNKLSSDNGRVYYERPNYVPFIGYWWRGIESGLMDALRHF